MFRANFDKIFGFFRNQSSNFKILLVEGILVGGGMREGVINALTRQYTSLYIIALGASKIQLGLVQSIGTAARIVFSIPIGQVIDRVSLKKMLLLSMILSCLSPLIYALAFNWYMVIPAILMVSISGPMIWTVRGIFLADSLKDTDRATGFGVMSTIAAIPGIVMPFVSAYVVGFFGGITAEGIRPLFFLQIFLLVPITVWVYWRIKEPMRKKLEKQPSFFESLKKFIILDKGSRMWLLVSIFDSFAMVAFPFTMVFAVEVKGATPSIIAWMGMANTFAIMIFTIPFSRLADRIGRKPVLYLGLVPTFSWILFLVYCPAPEWLIMASVLEGAFTATFPLWSTITIELIPEHLRGSYGGIRSTITGLSSMIATTVGGILWETVSPGAIFIAALAFETVAITLSIGIPETLKNKTEEFSNLGSK